MEGGTAFVLASSALFFLMHGVKSDFCESDWYLYEDMCIKFFDESIVQSETSEKCSSRGAHLLSALTPKLRDFLVAHMEEHSSYWCVTQTGKMDSRLLPSATTTLSPNAMITSPKTVSATVKKEESCHYIQDKALHEGKCDEPRGFVCEKDSILLPSTCPEGTEKIRSRCFWITPDLVSKTEAEESCSEESGRLASLQTTRKRTYALGKLALTKKNLWVGAVKQEGKIKWECGDILDTVQETSYIPIKDEGGNCVILGPSDVSKSGTSWIFRDCNTTAYGLCEKEATVLTTPTVTTTTVATTTLAAVCPGISMYDREKDGICYWETTYEVPRFDWDNARKFCQGYGGDLASYKDADEEELSLGSARGHFGGLWIGLRREIGSHVFRWSDGSTLTYTNWAPGQPKLIGNSKLCVAHTGIDSKWEVTYCGLNRWFVCKIPRATIPSNPVLPTKAPVTECVIEKSSPWITWIYHQGYCYGLFTERLTFDAAKMLCQDNGAFMASVHSTDEIDFLLGLFQFNPYGSEKNYWIGLSAKGILSPYRWDDGTPFDFVNWETDPKYDERSYTDTCAIFDISSGTWRKKQCNYLARVICKVQNGTQNTFSTTAPTTKLEGYCPDGWYTLSNKCYKIFGEKGIDLANWTEADKRCREIGTQLVSIHSKEEQDFLTLLVLSVQFHTWIGMYSTIGGRLFHWTDNSSMAYMNWGYYQPDFYAEEEECVHLTFNARGDVGKWNDIACSNKFAFICQSPRDPMQMKPGQDPFFCSEPKGWIKLGSSCYQIFNGSENRLSWVKAQSFCMGFNGKLAVIRNFAVSVILRFHLKDSDGLFWIGMRNVQQNTYRWLGTFPTVRYTNWLRGEPKQSNRHDNCVAVNANGEWMVRDCYERHPFICEESTGSVGPQEPDMVCPENNTEWEDLGGKFCYIFEIDNRVSWHDAAFSCFSKGGSLGSIHSAHEDEILFSRIKNHRYPVYIGLAQKEDGTFGWQDGTAVDYVNWNPGEPNYDRARSLCVEMFTHNFGWNDVSCSEPRGYICSTNKVARNEFSTENPVDDGKNHGTGLKAEDIAMISIGVVAVLVIAVVSVYCFHFSSRMRAKWQMKSTPL